MLVRRRRLLIIAVPIAVAVLVISFFVARFLTTENTERDDLLSLVQHEASGDLPGVLSRLHGCDAACQAKVRGFLPRVTGKGAVKIVLLNSGTAYSLGTKQGWSRLVWVHGVDDRPIVQCVLVERSGSPLTERSVSLLRLNAPLADNEDSC